MSNCEYKYKIYNMIFNWKEICNYYNNTVFIVIKKIGKYCGDGKHWLLLY